MSYIIQNKSIMIRYIKILLILIVTISCNSNENSQRDYKKYPQGLDCGKEIDAFLKKIDIPNGEFLALESFLEKTSPISITPLFISDTKFFLGKISKLWLQEGNYYVADTEISKKVYSFDKEGRMRFVLDNKGEGPGQYQMLWDVQFNLYHKRLEIWDLSLHKLLFFDLEGKFISEQKINLPIMSFFPVTKDWYAYHLDGRDNMGKKTPLLQLSDITGTQIINRGVYEYGIVDALFTHQEFSVYDSSPYFLRPMMDTIYWIGPVHGHICPTYLLDFKGRNIPEEAKKETDLMKAGQTIQQQRCAFATGELVVGSSFMSFEWTPDAQETKNWSFVRRSDMKAFHIKEKDLQLFGIKPEKMLSIENYRAFITYAFPHKVDKEKLVAAIANKDLPEVTRKELAKIQQLTDQEMPFLITFRLKHPESDGKP